MLLTRRLPEGKIVLLPGHEFSIEHFLPENLVVFSKDNVGLDFSRAQAMRSRIGQATFYVKRMHFSLGETSPSLQATSEAKLARHINSLHLPHIQVEEPLAIHLAKDREKSTVFYRPVKMTGWCVRSKMKSKIMDELEEHGIYADDLQVVHASDGSHHIIDIEKWKVSPELGKKLHLKANKTLRPDEPRPKPHHNNSRL